MTLLSIVIPCYQRHDLLKGCLASLERDGDVIQVILVDDGSEPSLESVFEQNVSSNDRYFRQPNRGRAAALREGLLRADGKYVMLMDSDDEFIPGAIDQVLNDIQRHYHENTVGFVYECINFDSGETIAGLRGAPSSATLLALRADHQVRGDLKEVVLRDVVLKELYPDPKDERRVPTSYIWAGVSSHGHVITRAIPIVRHRYLPGGMTKNIAKLKRENPKWLRQTYFRIAIAPPSCYKSRSFRFFSIVKFYAYGGGRSTAAQIDKLRVNAGWLLNFGAYVLGSLVSKVV